MTDLDNGHDNYHYLTYQHWLRQTVGSRDRPKFAVAKVELIIARVHTKHEENLLISALFAVHYIHSVTTAAN